jgi:4'-phosphopantetheinyl transferase EntD
MILEDHSTLLVLRRLVPETAVAGGSFARFLPHPRSLGSASRAAAFASAQELAIEECITGLLQLAGLPLDLRVEKRPDGARDWPRGFAGSLTHKGTVVLGAIAAVSTVKMIGLDLERIDHADLLPIETLVAAEGLPPGIDRQFGTLLAFSAKEAVFKAQHPVTRDRLDFSAVRLRWTGSRDREFRARVDGALSELQVRTACVGNWLMTCAIAI